MNRNLSVLDQVRIDKPCTADWNSMIGNDQVRFCEHCAKSVNDLSNMTVAQAERLVIKSNGNLCIRYQRLQDGSIKTVVKPKPFVELTRKISKIAAGAFAVALTVSNNAVAKPQNPKATVSSIREKEKAAVADEALEELARMVAGRVTGSAFKSVSGANISLRGKTTGYEYSTTSGAFGAFCIDNLPLEPYSISVTAPGFKTLQINYVDVKTAPVAKLDIMMREGDPAEMVVLDGKEELIINGGAMWSQISIQLPGVDYRALKKFEAGKIPAVRLNELTKILALHNAVSNNKTEAVNSLINAGAQLDGYQQYNEERHESYSLIAPALFSVSRDTSAEIIVNLIRVGADINAKDGNGRTPILASAEVENAGAVEELIRYGANVNDQDSNGSSVLSYFVGSDNAGAVKLLIDSGADVNHTDKTGRTVLINVLSSTWQTSARTIEIVRLLKQQGATEFIEEPNVKTDPINRSN